MLKIKKFLTKYKSVITFSIIGLIILVPISLLIYNSVSNKRNFVLANYQSYINPQVQKQLEKEYNISFDYFESAESAKTMLNKNTADIVNTTSYELVNWVKEGLVQKLDWKLFNIPNVENANDALKLFIKPVQDILKSYDIDGDGNKDNLLQYGIPYFLQDLVFSYRGEKIDQLTNDISWTQLFEIIVNESRFKNTSKNPKLMALDDPRTIFSIPRIMETQNSINPKNKSSIEELQDTYKLLANQINKFGKNSITFNSDSGTILNKLATNEINGAFCFNGDALYAAYGGDEGANVDIGKDIHVVKPKNNLVALDLFVINKNVNETNLIKSYDLISNLCLDTKNKNDSMPYINFDYVYYTSPLVEINNIVKGEITPLEYSFLEITDINISNRVELPLDDITKSNFKFAWTGFKSYL